VKNTVPVILFLFIILVVQITSCSTRLIKKNDALIKVDTEENKRNFILTLEKHLDAVSNKDLAALKTTMSPEGKMHLILPQTEIISSVDSFMNFHKEWFKDTSWTFETEILHTDIGDKFGMAITEIMYREPDRNGKPYFNRMIVTYGLEKINGNWYIIQDHASSLEKSTDEK